MFFNLIIFILTLLSCLIFDFLNLKSNSIDLLNSYKKLLIVLRDKTISDNEKQTTLFKLTKFQSKKLIMLIVKIFMFISPFSFLIFLDISFSTLLEIESFIISLLGVILFVLIKKVYEKILKN